mgnify:CR=1 FL=1
MSFIKDVEGSDGSYVAECFIVRLSCCRQELEQGESGGIGKGFSVLVN